MADGKSTYENVMLLKQALAIFRSSMRKSVVFDRIEYKERIRNSTI